MRSTCAGDTTIGLACELGLGACNWHEFFAGYVGVGYTVSVDGICSGLQGQWDLFSGDVYESQLLSGFDSRPLREDELHSRIGKTEHSLKAEISYFDIPISTGDEEDPEAVESWPVLLPSSVEPGNTLKHYCPC